jgi:hypothetical protein
MGRPKGSLNKATIEAQQKQVPAREAQQKVSAGTPNPVAPQESQEIRRVYKEGSGVITIPNSNSTAALFPEFSSQEVPQTASQSTEAQEITVTQETQETPVIPETTETTIQNNEIKPVEQEESKEIKEKEEIKPVEQEQISLPEGEEVYLEELLKKLNLDPSRVKTKTKIDGVESDVTLSEVKKSYQLDQHLTKRGQKIGEERRQLETLRQELSSKKSEDIPTGDTEIDSLKAEISQLKSLIPILEPVIYQNARQKVAAELKEQGFPDFMDYIDRIDARVGIEKDEGRWRYYNTPEGAKQLYFQMKLEEKMKEDQTRAKPVKTEPAASAKPPIVKIDGGAQPSRPVTDDWNAKYQELIAEWKKNPAKNKHLLTEILRLKGALTLQ